MFVSIWEPLPAFHRNWHSILLICEISSKHLKSQLGSMLEYEMLKLYQEGQLGFVLLRKCDHFLKKVSWEPCCSRNVSANQPKTMKTIGVCLFVTKNEHFFMGTPCQWRKSVCDEKWALFHFVSVCLSWKMSTFEAWSIQCFSFVSRCFKNFWTRKQCERCASNTKKKFWNLK